MNSELEVSPKTFKVYRFAGRPTTISCSVENILNKEHEQNHQQQNNHNMQNGNQSSIYQVWFYFNSDSDFVLIINSLSNNFLLIYKITTLELLEFHCHLHHLNPEKPILHISPTHLLDTRWKDITPLQIGTVYKKRKELQNRCVLIKMMLRLFFLAFTSKISFSI